MVDVPAEETRVQGTGTGKLRPSADPQNVGTITTGILTPPKILSCGIITDAQDRFVAHIHGSYTDYLHFLELRGVGEDGGCPLCEAGVLLLDPQLFHVVAGAIEFTELTNFTPFLIQLHPG